MTFISVRCPYCHSDQIVKRGKTRRGTQCYLCQNTACPPQSFLLEYRYQGRLPEVKQQIIDMSLNATGIRDTARVLRISTDTVLRALRKKEAALVSVNSALLRTIDPAEILVDIEQAGEAEVDEATAHYRQALALAEELGMRPLVAHCHRGLGTLYAKIGQQEQARAELSIAIELYKAMDMTFWLPQAEAALAQVEGQ
jgi:transposase-like protein